jgi:DNA repair exonuclease SbcCD ATPase subunit
MATPIEQSTSTNGPAVPPSQAPTNGPAGKAYTEEDLARVRQQEKDKLYKELAELREQVTTLSPLQQELEALRKEREEQAATEAAARQQAEEEARAKRESEMTAKELLEQRQREWEEKFAEMQAERQREQQLLEKEREFAQLRDYTQARIQQEKDSIAPELLDLVDGNTREEVDRSIELLKAKSAAIAEKVRGTQQQFASQQQGVSPSGFSTTGPMDMLPSTQQYSAEDIARMSMKEYAEKIRGNFVGRGDTVRNRGLFG